MTGRASPFRFDCQYPQPQNKTPGGRAFRYVAFGEVFSRTVDTLNYRIRPVFHGMRISSSLRFSTADVKSLSSRIM